MKTVSQILKEKKQEQNKKQKEQEKEEKRNEAINYLYNQATPPFFLVLLFIMVCASLDLIIVYFLGTTDTIALTRAFFFGGFIGAIFVLWYFIYVRNKIENQIKEE